MADQQHGLPRVALDDPVPGRADPAADRLERLAAGRHRGRIGQPTGQVLRPALSDLVEAVTVPGAVVGFDQAVLDGHRQLEPAGDPIRGLPGAQQW
jgi:hypothetical protein